MSNFLAIYARDQPTQEWDLKAICSSSLTASLTRTGLRSEGRQVLTVPHSKFPGIPFQLVANHTVVEYSQSTGSKAE